MSVFVFKGGIEGGEFILLAWALMTIYSTVAWVRGDYIQHALNIKPWTSRDEFQKEADAKAQSMSYMIISVGLAVLVGMFLNDIVLESDVEIFEPSYVTLYLFTLVTFLAFLSFTLPTMIMGWCLKPVEAENE